MRRSVVFPEPFGPRMPTKPPAGTSIDTPRNTGAVCGGYANAISAARSNPQPNHRAAAERRIAERFLVVAIAKIGDPAHDLQPLQHRPRRAGVPDVVARRFVDAAERTEARIDVAHAAAAAALEEGRPRPV